MRAETTKNYYSHDRIELPIGIAELGLPGVLSPPAPPSLPGTCQSNLLTVDGRPVSLRVTGSTADALDGKTLTVQACGPDAGGITLGPGTHVIQSSSGHATGFDIDQLVLDSAPGGGPEPETAGAPLPAPTPGPAPAVQVLSQTATSFHLKVTGLTAAAATTPFWLTLGESVNKGWQATVPGGKSLGPGTLIDGFANGWMVDPATLGAAVRDGTLDVTLTWLPQRHVNDALIISALAAALCLLLALLPNRWRRRIFFRRRRARRDAGPDAAPPTRGRRHALGHPHALGDTVAGVRDDPPELGSPLSAAGRRPPWWAFVVAPVLSGGIAAGVLVRPKIGLAIAAAVLLILIVRHLRWLLTLTALGVTASTAVWVIKHQEAFHFPAGGWPINFEPASLLAWTAVVLLAADAIIEVARRASATPAPPAQEQAPQPSPPLEPDDGDTDKSARPDAGAPDDGESDDGEDEGEGESDDGAPETSESDASEAVSI